MKSIKLTHMAQAKVASFLKIKYERGQHINTTLLSSSAFANPHIYAKLVRLTFLHFFIVFRNRGVGFPLTGQVEFVSIEETATAFPSGGWLTRRNLEAEIATYGPAALQAQQKAKQDAVRRSQEAGKRSGIEFAPAKHRDRDEGARRDKEWGKDRDRHREREKRVRREEGRGDGRYDPGRNGRGERGKDRERERERDREWYREHTDAPRYDRRDRR
jgi:hypothetical protein